MAFFQSNQNNGGGNNQNGGNTQKKNFSVTTIKGEDGRLNIAVWKSDRGGVYVVMNIAGAAGKDPTTGAILYESKQPNQLPSMYLNQENANTLYVAFQSQKSRGPVTIEPFEFKCGRDNKLTIAPDGSNIKMTLESPNVGPRTITFKGIPIGSTIANGNWEVLLKTFGKAVNKVTYNRMDPNEFNLGGSDDETSSY